VSGVGDPSEELVAAVGRHLSDKRIGREVAEVLAAADRAIEYYAPTCWNRGTCCRFGEAGHRLFVTVPELIYFGQAHTVVPVAGDSQVCPHQQDGRCRARRGRPLGCRVYFCQASARWWQPGVSEHYLGELRALGQRWGIPEAYVEWFTGLGLLCGATSLRR
jgi:hypothetical protein